MSRQSTIDGFLACKCSDVLRFSVGDRVLRMLALKGHGYALGKIVKQWDEGNAYLIELQDDDKTHVWGPIDEDSFVMAGPRSVASGSPAKRQRTM